jgi:hypothetical protein
MERGRCHGIGFKAEEYTVVIGPEPWPRPLRLETYTTAFCCLAGCLCQCLGQCAKCLAEDFCPLLCQLLCCGPWILLVLLPVMNFNGSRAPRTELEALTIYDLNLTRDNTSVVTPFLVTGNFTVLFQARNPSSVVGFRHRYLSTVVTVFYSDVQLGQSEVPRFSQGYSSARDVNASVVFREQPLNESVGSSLQSDLQHDVGLRITVDAYVKVKRLGWQDPKWFNLTCSVEATLMSNTIETGNLLTKSCH